MLEIPRQPWRRVRKQRLSSDGLGMGGDQPRPVASDPVLAINRVALPSLRPSPVLAMRCGGDLRSLLSVPGTHPGGHTLPDGTRPTPGGWNRVAP
jgi:hypothetical protein